MTETRNIRVEAARIARGNVLDLSEVNIDEVDALFMPGGFGAAKNFCSFAFDGPQATIDAEIKNFIQTFHQAEKPIGAVCIAPPYTSLKRHTHHRFVQVQQRRWKVGKHQVCPVKWLSTMTTNS